MAGGGVYRRFFAWLDDMKTSADGLKTLTDFEGFRDRAYLDIAGVWTIGYGFTMGVREGDILSRARADLRLADELTGYEDAVIRATKGVVTQVQFDALVCFAWNVGVAGMRGSSVIKAHNRGDYAAAARAFGLWNKAGGKIVNGLVRRRAAEAALYMSESVEIPQVVDVEKPLTSSTINKASVVAGSTAALASATQVIDSVAAIKYSISDLGDWLIPVLLITTLLAVGYIIFERYQQRQRGQA